MKRQKRSERGAAILMFGLCAPILLGMLALVLDVGWSYYISKQAQTATDAAAMAAVTQVLQQVGPGGKVTCGVAGCQAAGACPTEGNLHAACQYAQANGFTAGVRQQSFTIGADTTQYAPNVPNIPVVYWAQAFAQQSLPQWFSGLISSAGLKPSVTSTAALRSADLKASLYLLNHSSDCFASALNIGVVCGEDFLAVGFNSIHTENGIYMASSNGAGIGLPNIAAGTIAVGNVTVESPFTYLMGKGGIQNILAGTNWTAAPKNGFTDGTLFADPMAGKGQPPAPTGLPDHPVPGGVIVGNLFGAPTVLPPGNYYATLPLLNIASGAPIVITGNVVFSDGTNNPCGGFCNYVFYGGVVTGALSNVTFSPGRYVFAGAKLAGVGPSAGLTVGLNSTIKDLTPLVSGEIGPNTDAGEIFIFTDKNYPGLNVPGALGAISLPQVRAGVSAGLNPQVTLHGLNASSPNLPAELADFAPILIWQDQANTSLRYTTSGTLDTSCSGPCLNVLSIPGSQEMIIQASQNGVHAGVNMYGTIYQPRGAWLTVLGLLPGDSIAGPLQIITGALQMTLNTSLDLKALPNPPKRLVASLIQ